jgi:hypothetical protein
MPNKEYPILHTYRALQVDYNSNNNLRMMVISRKRDGTRRPYQESGTSELEPDLETAPRGKRLLVPHRQWSSYVLALIVLLLLHCVLQQYISANAITKHHNAFVELSPEPSLHLEATDGDQNGFKRVEESRNSRDSETLAIIDNRTPELVRELPEGQVRHLGVHLSL